MRVSLGVAQEREYESQDVTQELKVDDVSSKLQADKDYQARNNERRPPSLVVTTAHLRSTDSRKDSKRDEIAASERSAADPAKDFKLLDSELNDQGL